MSSLGEKIHEARTASDITVIALARACGVTRRAVHMWEADEREPTWTNIRYLAAALDRPVEFFVPDNEEEPGEPAADKAVHR